MTGVTATLIDALAPHAEGRGVQFFDSERPRLPGVPVQTDKIDAPDCSLDFVVVGAEWWTCNRSIELTREWRRCLREGGTLAVLVDTRHAAVAAVASLLATECGLELKQPDRIDDDTYVLVGTRDSSRAVRRAFASISREVTRTDRPDAWRGEFWFDLASVLLQAGEGEKASEAFAIVVKEDPNSMEARVGLAMSMALLADWDEAESILTEVLRTSPDHGLAADWLRRCRSRARRDSGDASVLTPTPPRTRATSPTQPSA